MFFVRAVALLGVVAARASPTISTREDIIQLTTDQINVFTPYTHYASAAYSPPDETFAWTCGDSCQANPSFKPVASGGDGASVQYWFVGYDPDLGTTIVGHQGTNVTKIQSVLTDLNFFLTDLDPALFPKTGDGVQCHSGFAEEQALTATQIFTAVEKTMSQYNTTTVTLVGHSLGAALALLDSVYLSNWLPSGTTLRTYTYALPRVGNQAFADYVDANLQLVHINNKHDPIPVLPDRLFGYVHPAGEIHVKESGHWVGCSGQDNPSKQCIVGDVPFFLFGDLKEHGGPYNGIMIGP